MLKIELLVGEIASGKSTYAKKRAREGAVIVNDDAVVTAVHGGDYTLYNDSFRCIYKNVGLTIIGTAMALGKDVIIDKTNLTVVQRKKYIGLAESYNAESWAIVFPSEDYKIHAQRRYDADSRGVSLEQWVRVARGHAEKYQEPCTNEGFAGIVNIAYS